MMTRSERLLYHQVHPLKLLTDITTSFASSWLLWREAWGMAALVAFLPSIVVSALLIWGADLEPWARTPIGRYVARFMTRRVEALRFAGQLVMWAGAALHIVWLLPLGLAIVVFGWLKGFWTPAAGP
jgi:hypothetical protein